MSVVLEKESGIAVEEISRDQLEKRTGLDDLIERALEGAPSEVAFDLVLIPSKVLARTREVAAAIDRLRKVRAAKGRKTTAVFDPYEAGRRLIEELKVAEGGAWSGSELLEKFKLTSATLHKRRKNFGIVCWRDAQSNFYYPKWQFAGSGLLLPGIAEVLRLFKSNDEWRVMGYFLKARKSFAGRRPLDLLREGKTEQVLKHASVHAEENTW